MQKGYLFRTAHLNFMCPMSGVPIVNNNLSPLLPLSWIGKAGWDTQPVLAPPVAGGAKGWLVVHDEKTFTQTFSLGLGKQVIGRKSETRPCDIMIDCNDPYMSRNHFIIDVVQKPGNIISYSLSDSGSKNRTFINARN